MRTALRRGAVGLYGLWLVAVVLYMAGRYTSFPMLDQARTGMVVGAGIFTLLGAAQILRNGVDRLTRD